VVDAGQASGRATCLFWAQKKPHGEARLGKRQRAETA